jgi:hypothetical protein
LLLAKAKAAEDAAKARMLEEMEELARRSRYRN